MEELPATVPFAFTTQQLFRVAVEDLYQQIHQDFVASSMTTEIPSSSFPFVTHCDAAERKKLHESAARANLYHISFRDDNEPFDRVTMYKCIECDRWCRFDRVKKSYCCVEPDGSPGCDSYVLICEGLGDDDEAHMIGTKDGLDDDIKKKSIKTNNAIAISSKLEDLYPYFRLRRIPLKAIPRWIRKRDAKYAVANEQ